MARGATAHARPASVAATRGDGATSCCSRRWAASRFSTASARSASQPLALLLTLERPTSRGAVVIATTYATYLLAGVALLTDWTTAVGNLGADLPSWTKDAATTAAVLVCLAAAWRMRRRGKTVGVRLPARLSTAATLLFAVGATASDVPTAIAYFVAIERIAVDDGAVPFPFLTWYCLLYCAPLLPMLALQAARPAGAARFAERVRDAVEWSSSRLLPLLAFAAGGWLPLPGANGFLTSLGPLS